MDDLGDILREYKFEKQLEKYKKKLKNKKIVLYGTGKFLETIKANYDLSGLNIIGISDQKYSENDNEKEEYGYKIILLENIANYIPDYIMVSTLNTREIIEGLEHYIFRNTKIKIVPLVNKPFLLRLKSFFCDF